MKRMVYLSFSLALVLTVSGCITYEPEINSPDGSDGNGSKPSCKTHNDCDERERCIESKCLSEPPPCGEEPPQCSWNEETQKCEGGWYICSHFCPDDPDCCWCVCPAGDTGCPCWTSAHCQGCCMGDEEDCENTMIGTCYDKIVSMPLGCHCLHYMGGFTWICAD